MRFFRLFIMSLALLGLCYSGHGLVKMADSREFKSVQEMAERGNAEAQRALGEAYSAGYLVRKNDDEALKWLTLSAEKGNASAQLSLASLCSRMGDKEGAARWLEKARINGCVGAARSVAELDFNSL